MARAGTLFHRFILYILLGAFFVEILLLGSQYISRDPQNNLDIQPLQSLQADQMMERVHLVEGAGAHKEWELFAKSAEGFIGQGVWNLQSVKVIFYTPEGNTFIVQGQRGQIDTSTKDIDISGQVSTRSTNGYDFKTEAIHYVSSKKILAVPQKIKMSGPKDQRGERLELIGEGITTFLDTSLMNIENSVVARRMMQNGKVIFIKSRKAQVSGRSNLVRFYDSVELKYEAMVLKGPEALFSYKKNADIPSSIILTGGVQLLDSLKQASAENIQIDLEEEKYILRGSPRVIQGGDVLRGQEIMLLDGGKRVRIQNINARVDESKGQSQEVK